MHIWQIKKICFAIYVYEVDVKLDLSGLHIETFMELFFLPKESFIRRNIMP